MAQTRAFAIIGPSLWNQLLPSTRSTLLTGEPVTLFVLSRLASSLWVSRTGSASDWCALQEALYKCIDTVQYNTIQQFHWTLLISAPAVGLPDAGAERESDSETST